MNLKIKMFAYIVAAAYLVAVIGTWISSELHGVTYFSAGEPNRAILYTEWVIGLIAVVVLLDEYRNSLIETKSKVIYDPLV